MTTPRENLLRTLHRQGFDWVPVDSNSFCPSQVEAFRQRFGHEDVASYFELPHRSFGSPLVKQYKDPLALFPRETLPEDISFDVFGIGHSRRPNCYHMTRMHHPLAGDTSLDEISSHPFPILDAKADDSVTRTVEEIHGRGLAACGGLACTIWETAWYLRSMEDLMVDMMSDDDRATVLLDRVTDLACQRATLYARAGTDIVELGDDIGMQSTAMMNPDLWRQWLKPRLARVIRETRETKPDVLIFYHSCGFVIPFLEDLIEVGVDILNPVQPECMGLAEVHKLTGGRLAYWGTIGTQTTLPFGKPEDVREVVRRNLEICGEAGGIVIGPTHMVEPEVPWENLEALRLAAKEYRRG